MRIRIALPAAALALIASLSPAMAAFDAAFVQSLCVDNGTYGLSPVEDAGYGSAGLSPITFRRETPLPVRIYQFEQRSSQARFCTVVFQSSRDGVICEEAAVAKSGPTLTRGAWQRLLCPSQQ